MDTINKNSQLSFHQVFNNDQAFTIKLNTSKFDSVAGADLLAKVESWVAANAMMSNQEVPTLIVDMENVGFIDSQGLQKLLASLRLMQAHQSTLALCSLQPAVRLVFEISRIDQVFGIFPSFDYCMDVFNMQKQSANYLVAA